MRIRPPVSAFARWLLLVIAGAAMLGPVPIAAAADHQKQVLVLYSTRRDAQIAVVGDRELPRILDDGVGARSDFYSEYIDRARFSDPGNKAAFNDFLRVKYQGHRFDLAIAMSEIALEFVAGERSELFRDTPAVFFTFSAATRRIANSTGVVGELSLSGSVVLATGCSPSPGTCSSSAARMSRTKPWKVW